MVGKDVVVDDDDMATLVPDVSGERSLMTVMLLLHSSWIVLLPPR